MRAKLGAVGVALALAPACAGDETAPVSVASQELAGTLAVDVRGAADVVISRGEASATRVRVTLRDLDAGGLFAPPIELSGDGRVEPFPEGGLDLHTAKLSVPASGAGPCGAEGVSLALSLRRAPEHPHVGGALTAYCGDRFYGVPARVFRLSGELGAR
jgi:hypothetical protein